MKLIPNYLQPEKIAAGLSNQHVTHDGQVRADITNVRMANPKTIWGGILGSRPTPYFCSSRIEVRETIVAGDGSTINTGIDVFVDPNLNRLLPKRECMVALRNVHISNNGSVVISADEQTSVEILAEGKQPIIAV